MRSDEFSGTCTGLGCMYRYVADSEVEGPILQMARGPPLAQLNPFTKCPIIFAVSDQKAEQITGLLCEELVPFFGVTQGPSWG